MQQHLAEVRSIRRKDVRFKHNNTNLFGNERDNLIIACLPIAMQFAGSAARNSNFRIEYSDVLAAAYIGICEAANRYLSNEHNTAKFSTYAVSWINKHIQEYIKLNSSLLSANLSSYKETNKVQLASGDDNVGKDGERAMTRFDFVAGDNTAENIIEANIAETAMKCLIECLTAQEKCAIKMKFGIGAIKPYQDRDIADKIGINKTQVDDYVYAAIQKLRSLSNSLGITIDIITLNSVIVAFK